MSWNRHYTIMLATAFCGMAMLLTQDAAAQSMFKRGYNQSYDDYLLQLRGYRIGMMAFSTLVGFAFGWFLSPDAREFRRTAFWAVAAAAILIAVFNDGVLGWSMASIVSVFGAAFAFGYWIGAALSAMAETPTTFGSSEWADAGHLADKDLFGSEGLIIGKAFDGTRMTTISYKGDRHALTVAPTRSGKGTSHIIPNLLTYEGSALVIDPKGENAMITASARQNLMGQSIHIVDPWGITHDDQDFHLPSRFNPLDWLVMGDIDIAENAMLLADAMIVPDGNGDHFWIEEAKAYLQGMILYVATDREEVGQRNLGRVRDLLLLDGDDLQALYQHMTQSMHHLVASTGARCLQKEPKLLANVLASVQAQTHFLDSARIRESLSASDFAFEDLKTRPMTIYLVLPADRLNAFGRFLRLLVQQAITVNARNIKIKPAKPVLFILDELPALGRLTMVEQAYSLMAGFGLQVWGIVQDLGQLKGVYGDQYESFIANSGVVSYFGSPDAASADYFSSLCGVTTVWNFSSAVGRAFGSSSGGSGGASSNNSITNTDTRGAIQRKLAYPDELMRLNQDHQLVLIENTHPIIAHKARWFEDASLVARGRDIRSDG